MGVTAGALLSRNNLAGLSAVSPAMVFNLATAKTVANSAVETSLIDTTGAFGSVTLPANFLQVGSLVVIKGYGYLQTDVALPSLTFRVTYGATQLSTSGAIAFTAQVVSSTLFEYTATFSMVSIGASATARTAQISWLNNLSNSSFGSAPSTATIDTTTANALDIKATWSAASASNSVTLNNLMIEVYR